VGFLNFPLENSKIPPLRSPFRGGEAAEKNSKKLCLQSSNIVEQKFFDSFLGVKPTRFTVPSLNRSVMPPRKEGGLREQTTS